jgi:hypothetical protein
MTDYCTLTQIKQDMPDSPLNVPDYDAALLDMITSASRLIDQTVGRWPNYFLPSTDPETRYYNGASGENLYIDECAGVTEVAVSESGGLASSDYTVWATGDYIVEPYNYSALNIPIRRIVIDYTNGAQSAWLTYRKGVRVKGYFGWATSIPSPVNRCCRIQVARWWVQARAAYQDAGGSPDLGQITYDRAIETSLINKYLKQYILENSLT